MDDEGNIVLRLYGVDKSVVTTTILMIDWIVAVADNESGGVSVSLLFIFFVCFESSSCVSSFAAALLLLFCVAKMAHDDAKRQTKVTVIEPVT